MLLGCPDAASVLVQPLVSAATHGERGREGFPLHVPGVHVVVLSAQEPVPARAREARRRAQTPSTPRIQRREFLGRGAKRDVPRARGGVE